MSEQQQDPKNRKNQDELSEQELEQVVGGIDEPLQMDPDPFNMPGSDPYAALKKAVRDRF